MPGAKGNQNAKGCTTNGAKKVYTEQRAKEEALLLREWAKKPDSIVMMDFYADRGYCYQRSKEMEEISVDYREAKRYAMCKIGARREKGGLFGDYDSAIVRKSMGMYDHELRNYEREMKNNDLDNAVAVMNIMTRGLKDSDNHND